MKKIKVLFVDDEKELVSAVVERLGLRDIDAIGATDGFEAIKKIAEMNFDVAILDVRMPGIGGLDVLRRFKNKQPLLEVILLSGHGSLDNVEEGRGLGAFDYLQKPVDIEQLMEIIRRAASKKKVEVSRK